MQKEQEEIKEIKRTLSDLTAKFEDKFDELSKSVEEQQENAEEKINENATQEGRIASLESTRASGHATTQAGLLLRRMDSLEKHAGANTSPDPRRRCSGAATRRPGDTHRHPGAQKTVR